MTIFVFNYIDSHQEHVNEVLYLGSSQNLLVLLFS